MYPREMSPPYISPMSLVGLRSKVHGNKIYDCVMQYDVADHLARLLSKMPAWQSPSSDEEAVGRSYETRADFLAERYKLVTREASF